MIQEEQATTWGAGMKSYARQGIGTKATLSFFPLRDNASVQQALKWKWKYLDSIIP